MPSREQMQGLVQEILGAYEDRSAGWVQLRKTVKADLQGLEDSRIAMSRELHATLTKAAADTAAAVSAELRGLKSARSAMSRSLKAELANGTATLRRDVGGRLGGYDQAHAAMSREMKSGLARGVADRKRNVGSRLGGYDQAHAAMSREMKSGLARGVADRKRNVGGLLRGFDQAHAAVTQAIKAGLAESVADRKRDVGSLLGGFERELNEIRVSLAGGHDEWQKLATTMQGKRGVLLAEVKAPEAPMPPPVEEMAEAEAMARAEPIEMTPETAGLRERIFEYLANHPDGAKMTGLEEEFTLSRIQMARILKSLIDDNKVEKRDLYYFAI